MRRVKTKKQPIGEIDNYFSLFYPFDDPLGVKNIVENMAREIMDMYLYNNPKSNDLDEVTDREQ